MTSARRPLPWLDETLGVVMFGGGIFLLLSVLSLVPSESDTGVTPLPAANWGGEEPDPPRMVAASLSVSVDQIARASPTRELGQRSAASHASPMPYARPPLCLLNTPTNGKRMLKGTDLSKNATALEENLGDFGVDGRSERLSMMSRSWRGRPM